MYLYIYIYNHTVFRRLEVLKLLPLAAQHAELRLEALELRRAVVEAAWN